MEKQCINCIYDKVPPNRNCACFTQVKYPLVDIVEMEYDDGMSTCKGFKKARRDADER